jgi:hypothetical protein
MSAKAKPSSKDKPSSSSKKTGSRAATLVSPWVAILLAAALVGVAVQTHGQLGVELAGPRHALKRFHSFAEFFPYYVEEHSQAATKLLHAVGTSIVVLFAVTVQPYLVFTTATAVSVGFILAEALAGLAGGLVEGGVMALLFLGLNRAVLGRTFYELLVIAYGFAWAAHFFVEHNKPATFLFPSYSFAGDFYMLFQLALQRIPLDGTGAN